MSFVSCETTFSNKIVRLGPASSLRFAAFGDIFSDINSLFHLIKVSLSSSNVKGRRLDYLQGICFFDNRCGFLWRPFLFLFSLSIYNPTMRHFATLFFFFFFNSFHFSLLEEVNKFLFSFFLLFPFYFILFNFSHQ